MSSFIFNLGVHLIGADWLIFGTLARGVNERGERKVTRGEEREAEEEGRKDESRKL